MYNNIHIECSIHIIIIIRYYSALVGFPQNSTTHIKVNVHTQITTQIKIKLNNEDKLQGTYIP